MGKQSAMESEFERMDFAPLEEIDEELDEEGEVFEEEPPLESDDPNLPPLEESEENGDSPTSEPERIVDTELLNRIFDGRMACRQLSDEDLFDLQDWHKTLKKMLRQKGDRFLLAIQSVQIDLDKIDRMIDHRHAKRLPPPAVQTIATPRSKSLEGTYGEVRIEEPLAPENEGTIFVLSKTPGWKQKNVEGMILERQAAWEAEKELVAQSELEKGSNTDQSQSLRGAYNGKPSPYGYQGTFS